LVLSLRVEERSMMVDMTASYIDRERMRGDFHDHGRASRGSAQFSGLPGHHAAAR
jgi:hypothetical protein